MTSLKLPLEFYLSEDVITLAEKLLGKVLCTTINGKLTSGIIVETEAYKAPEDKASHAYQNKLTDRTKVMFRPGGIAYIYLCYGIHHLFNVVTGPGEKAHAVLVRALEPLDGIQLMLNRRKLQKVQPRLTAGPGSLSKALGITTALCGEPLTEKSSKIWLEDRGITVQRVIRSPRVGVDYAEECAAWNWRLRIKDNDWTSKAK